MVCRMPVERRNMMLRMLVEGNSIRSVCRLMGTSIPRVLYQLEWAGEHCANLLNQKLIGLHLRHVECDEIWTFCGKKQAHVSFHEFDTRYDLGDQYLFTAQDQDTRLIAAHLVGKRSANNTRRFMVQLRNRMADLGVIEYPTVQISTDGWAAYPEAVDLGFSTNVQYGQLIKQYRNARMQYDPGQIIGSTRKVIRGGLEPRSICTSHVERNNLTIRTFMKRYARLSLGFSKKLENLEAAVNLHMAYYNFCWRPGKMKVTPAQAAGIADRIWTFDDLLAGQVA